jgi:hypothetical protein
MAVSIYYLVFTIIAIQLNRIECADYKLVWSDEFNGDHINENDWKFDMDCLGNYKLIME